MNRTPTRRIFERGPSPFGENTLEDKTMPSAAERVNAALTTWDDTFDSGNATTLAALYTADAWVLPSQSPAVTGTAALTAFFQGAFAAGMTGHVLTPFDIIDLGETLIASSHWQAQVVKSGEPTATVGGLATHVLQQQSDGSLRVRTHIYNNGPLPA